jgi:hypothetical protein
MAVMRSRQRERRRRRRQSSPPPPWTRWRPPRPPRRFTPWQVALGAAAARAPAATSSEPHARLLLEAFRQRQVGLRSVRSLGRPAAPLPGPAPPPRPCAASGSARRRRLARASSAARPRHRRPGASEGWRACPALLPPYPVGAPASSGALGPAVGGRAAGRPAVHHRHYYTNCFDIIRFLPCTGHEALIQHPYIHVLRASEHRRRPAAGVSNSLRISQLWAQRRYTM